MNLDQSASYLRISRATLERWIRQGLLADAGLRGEHLDAKLLAAWAQRHDMRTGSPNGLRKATAADLFADAIARGAVTHGTAAKSANEAIAQAIAALELSDEAQAKILSETLERERLATTALGNGVAIPHPRHPQGDLIGEARVSLLYLDPALDWAAADGLGVHTVILILSPETRLHLQLLSRIAFALRDPGFSELLTTRPERQELSVALRRITRDS